MPFLELYLKDIKFDPKVQTYCNNPKFQCPNYSKSWACPPEAPYMKDPVSQFKKFFLIYSKFNLKPLKIRNEVDREEMENEIHKFLDNYNEDYNSKLILWDGYCRVCHKEDKKCTYQSNKPCRYPNEIRYSMEAVGIDVDKTVKKLNIKLEWPPKNYAYRFSLICFK